MASVDFLRQPDGELMPTLELCAGDRPLSPHATSPTSSSPTIRFGRTPSIRITAPSVSRRTIPPTRRRATPTPTRSSSREGLEPHKTAEVWYFNAEHPDLFVDITESIERKFDALKAHVSPVGDRDDDLRPRSRPGARDGRGSAVRVCRVLQSRRAAAMTAGPEAIADRHVDSACGAEHAW